MKQDRCRIRWCEAHFPAWDRLDAAKGKSPFRRNSDAQPRTAIHMFEGCVPAPAFAAHAACAIYSGGAQIVRKDMQASTVIHDQIALSEIDPLQHKIHPTIALVQQLLADADSSGPGTLPQIPVADELLQNIS